MITTEFLAIASAFADGAGIGLRTLSSRVFNDAKILPRLAGGHASITLRRAEVALAYFMENWPVGAVWPDVQILAPPARTSGGACPDEGEA